MEHNTNQVLRFVGVAFILGIAMQGVIAFAAHKFSGKPKQFVCATDGRLYEVVPETNVATLVNKDYRSVDCVTVQ